ncbi:MAG TPA: hydrogenase maturation protein [Rhodospirillaceae bacterium]|nr:hydrogenase maturation protein [Rhodospirillaceae bacterium]
MRILLLTHAFNSLTQRLFVELRRLGHAVTVEFDIHDAVTIEAVALAQPDLIIAPFLKRAIPAAIWQKHVCLVVHPGIEGDRGPSALDWAIFEGQERWGITVFQAVEDFDAGPVWETRTFAMRPATKSSLYRQEVTESATEAVLAAVARFPEARAHPPKPGVWKPLMRQSDRAIDWSRDQTSDVLRKIRAADGMPGVASEILGLPVYCFDARDGAPLVGPPGVVVARGQGAVALGTLDGAVWIRHLRRMLGEPAFKLPAERILADRLDAVPQVQGPQDIWYEEDGDVGVLHFAFYNGAMATDQCRQLLAAYEQALSRPTRVIVLAGGAEYWSNGIHLNLIEAAASPADESWQNINAMNDLTLRIITTTSHLTVASLQGNAGAGGFFLALAADQVWARQGVVLNPHYKSMGNLFGSEYWTYLLPRRVGPVIAGQLTEARLPMGAEEALSLGLIDGIGAASCDKFMRDIKRVAAGMAADPRFPEQLVGKKTRLEQDEKIRPLQAYRDDELAKMRLNFYGFDPSYHVARYNFVHKLPKSRTPPYLAVHRHKG